MPTVTVQGGVNNVLALQYTTNDAVAAARALANTITNSVNAGTAGPFAFYNGTTPPPSGVLGVGTVNNLIQLTPQQLPAQLGQIAGPGFVQTVIVNAGPNGTTSQDNTVVGADNTVGISVLADSGGLFYYTGSGSTGTVVAGDGNNVIGTASTGGAGSVGGAFNITTGAGNDTINALRGNNTVAANTGNNLIFLGTGQNLVTSAGTDTIYGAYAASPTVAGGGGNDTVNVTGTNSVVVYGNTSNFYFANGGGSSTVFGALGSSTVFAGAGGGQYFAGVGGNSRLNGGTGKATLGGGNNGDILNAGGSAGQVLQAGAGNETLTGSNSTGNNTFYAAGGNDAIFGGAGNDTIFVGRGSATIDPGAGADIIAVRNGFAGGSNFINGFQQGAGDRIALQLYGPNAAANAIATATVNPFGGGAVTIRLSDNTQLTFNGLTSINSSFFA